MDVELPTNDIVIKVYRNFMKSDRAHILHLGERKVQERRHTPEQLVHSIPHYIHTDMPQQHADFYSGLSYLPMCTMDRMGRPWASILVTRSERDTSIGARFLDPGKLTIESQMSIDDPFYRALKSSKDDASDTPLLFAGVGVDFANRRRNKIAGKIASIELGENGKVVLQLDSDEHLGNCPKYITVRDLVPKHRAPKLAFDHINSFKESLSEEAKSLIDRVSSVFFATKHVPSSDDDIRDQADMGLNHRGGAPGFVRVYEEPGHCSDDGNQDINTYLVLPDFSGNRFYQSLGNVESSQLVGLVFPDFSSGDMLYITGKAENLFDADAESLMPRVSLITRIQVTGAVLIQNALSLALKSDEKFSLYNPPIRYLKHELETLGHANNRKFLEGDQLNAKLVSVYQINENVSTFRFKLPKSIDVPLPGGFGVFDFSQLLDTGYIHMNDDNPQGVNENYIRTWTLSSAPEFDSQRKVFKLVDQIDITVKHKVGGLISNFLHVNSLELTRETSAEITLKGTGGGFTCFNAAEEGALPVIQEKMLWLAGGVGITPFMSMWDGLLNMNNAYPENAGPVLTDIVLVFAGRGDDIALLRHFLRRLESVHNSIPLQIIAYQSESNKQDNSTGVIDALRHDFPNANLMVHHKRMEAIDLSNISNLLDREVFMCGPDSLTKSASEWLESQSKGSQTIHLESYFF